MNKVKKTLVLPIVALMTVLMVSVSSVQATNPAWVDHNTYEGPFDGDLWAKVVAHGVIVVMEEYDGLLKVKMTRFELIRLYEYLDPEVGGLVAIIKLTMQYVGTITGFGGEGPFDNLWTGKMVGDWTINVKQEGYLPGTLDLKGHLVVWFEEGLPVKELGFGEPPW